MTRPFENYTEDSCGCVPREPEDLTRLIAWLKTNVRSDRNLLLGYSFAYLLIDLEAIQAAYENKLDDLDNMLIERGERERD